MNIKYEKLWKRHGEIIQITEDINDYEDELAIPKGSYQIIEKDEYGYELFNIKTYDMVHTEGAKMDGLEFRIMYADTQTILETMYDALTRQALNLTAEGWTINEDKYDRHSLDIAPLLGKIKVIKILLETSIGKTE